MTSPTEGQQTPQRYTPELAIICADHTRRLQLLDMAFWSGKVDTQQYRKQSRELTQQFVNELTEYWHRLAGRQTFEQKPPKH